LANFQVRRSNNNTALLQWATTSEVNFSHFELECSYNATVFTTIASVAGINNPNGSSYSYTHMLATNATKYYRLKMIDKNGSISYSKILTDEYNYLGTPLTVFPTIANGNSVIANFKTLLKATQLQVVKENGQIINTYKLQKGASNQIIETISLSKGIYFVRLIGSETVQTTVLIKQ